MVDMEGPGVMTPCFGFNERAGLAVLFAGDQGMVGNLMAFLADNIGVVGRIGLDIRTVGCQNPMVLPDDDRGLGKDTDQLTQSNPGRVRAWSGFFIGIGIQRIFSFLSFMTLILSCFAKNGNA
jgi:hypothetical protein